MKRTANRGLAMLMALVMCFSLLPAMGHHAHAAESVNYVSVTENKTGQTCILNWGTRGEVATFLSPNAEDFYTTNSVGYEAIAALEGGTIENGIVDTALYDELSALMRENHIFYTGNYADSKYNTVYGNTRYWYQYTDCQNNDGVPYCFYTGAALGAWDSGATWNREHLWPNSKGDGASDTEVIREADIIMLRPVSSIANSSRGNKPFGESSNYQSPNFKSTNGYDMRGDVARTLLYVYVCWGGDENYANGAPNYMWGSNGVIESAEVLLKWMAADPVDTWEMGRNDSVESITGTRNVFVDYPELAFLLFGEELPENWTTPSGEALSADGHIHSYVLSAITPATCTTAGAKVYTCTACGDNYETVLAATGHDFVDGTCTGCEASGNAFVIYYPAGNLYLTDTASGTTLVGGTVAEAVQWKRTVDENGYYVFESNGKYLTATVTVANDKTTTGLALSDTLTDCSRWEVEEYNGGYSLRNTGAAYNGNYNQYLEYYKGFTVYSLNESKADIYTFLLFDRSGAASCEHSETIVSCVNPTFCAACGTVVAPAVGHTWMPATCQAPKTCTVCDATEGDMGGHYCEDESGLCAVCGNNPLSAAIEATLTFDANKASRTEYSTSKQVWVQNGITFTNEKASSTTNVADYGAPVRLYKSSSITVEHAGMTQIVFDCNSSSYATALKNSIGDSATVSSDKVTVTFDPAENSFTVAALTAQVRMDSITVSAEPKQCAHTTTAISGSWEATCTARGYEGDEVCSECGMIFSKGNYTEPTGHSWSIAATCTAPETCANCDGTRGEALGHSYTSAVTKDPACNAVGVRTYTCGQCSDTYTEDIPATFEHNFEDGSCSVCGKADPSICSHDWAPATCKELSKCRLCGTTTGTYAEHSWADATCTAPKTCSKCGATEGEVLGHNWVDATCTAPKTCSKCGATEGEVLGHSWVDATCKAPKTCSVCSATEGTVADHNYVNGTCSVCGEADPNAGGATEAWTLVTNVSDLQVGDKIIIAAKGYNKALSTTQNGNNRGSAAVTKSGDTVTFGDDVQIITLEAGKKASTLAFKVDTGYLYAASGSKNYLKTETTLSDNSSWSITITNAGVATIKAQGSNTRNWLRFNSSNSPQLFSCYSSGQADVAIYKLTVSGGETECNHEWIDATCTAPKTCSKCGATEGEVLGHNWVDATCTAPKTCSKCGATEGEVLGHSWVDATCKAPKTCSVCSATEGTVADHSYTDGTCTVCGEADPNAGGVNYYTISLDAKGGTLVTESVETDAEGKVSELPTPTREGYTFGGWYTDAACTTAFDITSVVTADITLYAKWTVNKYTVSFEVDGIEDQEVAYNGKATEPTAPTKTGYTFGGWYTDAACTTAYDFNTLVTADITLYAKWTKNAVTPVYPSIPSVPSGTTTTTTKNEDGSTTTTKTDKTTGTVTETTKHTNGTTATVTTASDGTVKTEVTLSTKAVADAVKAGEAIELPIEGVTGATDSAEAATITINVQSGSNEKVSVHVPVVDVNESTVVILVNEDGTEKVIIDTKMDEDGLLVDVPDGAVVKIVDNAIDFTDVGEKDWEQKAVNFASARGLVKGVSTTENVFDLDATTTFAQVVTLLAHLEGVDTTPEAGEKWYNKGVAWAEELGITCDGELDVTISRQNMIAVMWRYAGSPESEQDLTAFADSADVTDNNLAALRWAVEVGLVKGDGNGVLSPNGDFTRGQLAQIFMNFVQLSWN